MVVGRMKAPRWSWRLTVMLVFPFLIPAEESLMTSRSNIGDAPRRREDARFITGQGRYLDDLRFDGLAHAVLLRSPHAHARSDAIDTTAARAMPGVLAVLTADDVLADGLQPLRPTVEANVQTGEMFAFAAQPLLAQGKVRHVGEPVA